MYEVLASTGPSHPTSSLRAAHGSLVHDFDLLRFVTGDEVARLHAGRTTVGFPVFEATDDYSTAAVTLWMESGALAVLTASRKDPVGYDVRMEVFGTEDSVVVGLDERAPIRSIENGARDPIDPYRDWLTRFGESYRSEMSVFLDVARGLTSSPCNVRDARVALLLAELATKSAREGRIVATDELE